MATLVVTPSKIALLQKQVPCAETTKSNDFVVSGAKRGYASIDARKGDNGLFYTVVDTGALIRLKGVTAAFTDGQTVYITPGGAFTTASSGNAAIGFADRAKPSAAAGDLWVQLVPTAV